MLVSCTPPMRPRGRAHSFGHLPASAEAQRMWIFGADSPPDPDFAERPAAVILAACSYASQPVAAKGVCRRIEPTSIELALPARQHRGELHARRVPHTNCRPQGSKALAANAPRGAAPDPQWPATCCIVPPSISAVEPRRRYYSRAHIGNAPRSLCSFVCTQPGDHPGTSCLRAAALAALRSRLASTRQRPDGSLRESNAGRCRDRARRRI